MTDSAKSNDGEGLASAAEANDLVFAFHQLSTAFLRLET